MKGEKIMTNREDTKVFLNTWGAYNEGCIGYGWFRPAAAREFIEENPERDGGEWFIADVDNYLGIDFGALEYANVEDVIDTIETLEDMEDWEIREVVAMMEFLSTRDVQEAIDGRDSYTIFDDIDAYYESCDELLDFRGNEMLERYFDWEAYHRDCAFDIYEASNGICIL